MDRMVLLSVLLSQLCWSVSLDFQYHFIDKKMSWSEAQSYCREHYTDLASVNDMKDLKNLKAAANGRKDAWIGLQTRIQTTDRKWHWSQPTVRYEDGDAQWGSDEPNDKGGKENCGAINISTVNWFDTSCPDKYSCIICYNESSGKPVMINNDTNTRTWLEAQQFCRTHHTDLMSGLDQHKLFQEQNPEHSTQCWIGLVRDTWVWSDRSDSSFRNWNWNSMKNNPPEKNCAALGAEGRWESDDCGEKKSFICHGGSFVLVKEKKTWEEALIHCRHNYHDLAWSIDTEPWKTEARKEIKKAESEFVWVGLHFACFFEEWFWVNGHYVSATHKNWNNPRQGKCGDVAAVKTETGKKWYKKKGAGKYNFICMRSCPCNG